MTVILAARQLSAGYGKTSVVSDLDLEVNAGEVLCLLGPNGAGKSTTILTLAGALAPQAGHVEWEGHNTVAPLHRRVRGGLGLVTEQRAVFMSLTVEDNIAVSGADRDTLFDLFPELDSRRRVKAGQLSGGEQQMLAMGTALAAAPRALLVDEMSLGLAPQVVKRLMGVLRLAADGGVAVLLVEQHVPHALEIADSVCVMRQGAICLRDRAAAVRGDIGRVEGAYFADDHESASSDPPLRADAGADVPTH